MAHTAAPTAGLPIRCKAAVSRAAGEVLAIEEVVVGPPQAYEVRIKIVCASLCRTDVTFWRSKDFPGGVFPRIFGHEGYGVVESVGEHVEEVGPGEVVVPVGLGHCQQCVDCASERSNLCSVVPVTMNPWMPRGMEGSTRFTDATGAPVYHFAGVSSFSEYTVVDVAQLVKVDPTFPPAQACLLSCGVSTGVGAAWKVAGVQPGTTVAIFGLGAIGLAVAEGCRLRGASKIIGVDVNPDKFEIGKKFGLTDFVNPKDTGEKSISQIIKGMTDGGADYCFECIGLVSTMNDACQSSRKGWGKTIIIGLDMAGSPLCLNPLEILMEGKCIMGSVFGGIKAKTDIPILAKQYLSKELHLDEFITHEVAFQDINKAFDLLVQGKSIRCTIWMTK